MVGSLKCSLSSQARVLVLSTVIVKQISLLKRLQAIFASRPGALS